MPFLFLYLIKVSVLLAAVYLLYRLLLQHLTFYQCNRWYLLGHSLLSFAIPFVDITPALPVQTNTQPVFVRYVPDIETIQNKAMPIIKKQLYIGKAPFDWWHLITLGYILVACFLCIRLLLQFISLYRLKRSAALVDQNGSIKLFELEKAGPPFSFGRSIFLHRAQHPEGELQEIIRHEMVHVQQWHSVDVLFAEILCTINWFNPFAWFIRHSIKQNLEYLADDKVLKQGVDKKVYQYLLLKITGNFSISITSTFNFRDLKNRISMMNRAKSTKLNLCRFLCALPLCALLLLACRAKVKGHAATNQSIHVKNHIVYIGRLVLDKDNLPVTGVSFQIKTNGSLKATIQTDENGMAFFEDDLTRYNKQVIDYELTSNDPRLPNASGGFLAKDTINFVEFQSIIPEATDPGETEFISFPASIPLDSVMATQNKKAFILRLLQQQAKDADKKYKEDKAVSDEFVKNGKHGDDLIQLYHGKLFTQLLDHQGWKVIGDPENTTFFLDDDSTSYSAINNYFCSNKKREVKGTSYQPQSKTSRRSIMWLESFATFKLAPSPKLLRPENMELHNASEVKNIDPKAFTFVNGWRFSVLDKTPHPQNNPADVTLLVKFKGPLAKYYDERLNELWWVETKDYNLKGNNKYFRPAFPKSLVP